MKDEKKKFDSYLIYIILNQYKRELVHYYWINNNNNIKTINFFPLVQISSNLNVLNTIRLFVNKQRGGKGVKMKINF